MKIKKMTPIDAVHCVCETDEGEKHMTIEEANKLMVKPKSTKKATKSVPKKT